MRKMRTRETAAAEMHASAHTTDVHTSAHAADMHAAAMHPSAHASAMHTASHPAAMHAATAATPATGERRRRKSKRRSQCARDEPTKKLVVHPNSSVVELQRRIPSLEEDDQQTSNDPTISNDKCDSF
jgi:hypothetical protein